MKFYLLLVIPLLIALLTACGPIYRTDYTYQPPHSPIAKMCTSQCLQNQSNCEQMCQMRHDNCLERAHERAIIDFEAYSHERRVRSEPVEWEIGHFDHSWQCNEGCDCKTPYNACYQACGGKVTAHEICTAFCDKK